MSNQPYRRRDASRIRFQPSHAWAALYTAEAAVFLPASIERSVWEYFSDKAERKGIGLSELLTDVLKRDIEINEALK